MDVYYGLCYNTKDGFITNLFMTDSTLSHLCPRCQQPTTWQNNPYRPFCSERCKLIDLGAWANEEYKIAAEDTPFSDELSQ